MVSTNGSANKPRSGEIAAVTRDLVGSINTFSRYFLRTEDAGILSKGQGKRYIEILRTVEKDTKVSEGLAQRFGAVLAREVVVEPASESRLDKKVADEVRAQINGLGRRTIQAKGKGAVYSFGGFDQFTLGQLDAILMGFAVSEIDWQIDGNRVYAKRLWNRDQGRFNFNVVDGGYELRLITPQSLFDGEQLPERKFLVNTYGSKIGNPYGAPLAEKLFWWTLIKKEELKFWLIFSDKYGSPTMVGHYQNERQRDKLLDLMRAVSQQAGVALPEGVTLDVLSAASGHTSTYQDLCNYCDSQIVEAILLQNLTTTVEGGSYAAAETHFEVRSELTDSDCSLLTTGPYADLATWITEYNFGADATPPLVYRPRQRIADLNRAQRDQILVGLVGRPLSEEYLSTMYDAAFLTEEEVAEKQQKEQELQQQQESPFQFKELEYKAAAPKQKTCKKGFACGATCIAKGRKCNKKLDGDAAKAADYLDQKVPKGKGSMSATDTPVDAKPTKAKAKSKADTKSTQKAPQTVALPTRDEAKKNLEFLGEGIEGPVYRDGDKAIKYLKVPLDQETIDGISVSGDLGIGPKFLGTSDDKKVLVIEYLEGYTIGFNRGEQPTDPYEDLDVTPDPEEQKKGLTGFIKSLKIAHDNGYEVADLHEDNFMSNAKSEFKFIDQGGFSKQPPSVLLTQLLDKTQAERPMAATVVERYARDFLDKKTYKEIVKTRRQFTDGNFTTEGQHQEALDKVYQLLGF